MTSPAMTVHGVILGTAAYMSPEQARGHAVDQRGDIWAFGVVLYEMLTGRTAFPGATVTDTLARLIERDPDWSALPNTTPPQLRTLLRRCLEKDLRKRAPHIGLARLEVDDSLSGAATGVSPAPSRPRRSPRSMARIAAAAAVIAILSAGFGYWMRSSPRAGSRAGLSLTAFAHREHESARAEPPIRALARRPMARVRCQ